MSPVHALIDDEAITAQFLRSILDDRMAGTPRALEEYLARWPGREDALRRAWEDLDRPEAETPVMIGPYRLLRKLGAGGQGEVHLAEDSRLNRRVAIKVLRSFSGAGEDRDRFRREARLLAPLNHPAICPVLDVGIHGDAPYLVMRYIEGESLEAVLRAAASPPPDVQGALGLALKLAHALSAAHAAGVVHRDLKPANIMILPRENGESPRLPLHPADQPVLLDFGLAGPLFEASRRLTTVGDRFGTPHYMAPEQIEAVAETRDPRVDVYALGVILYRLVTARLPFEGPTQAALFHSVLTRSPPDPRPHNPSVSRDLSTVILTALEKDPRRRYASAEAFARDLEALSEGRPVSVRRPGLLERSSRWMRKHPARAAALAFGLSALVLGGILTWKWRDLTAAEAAAQAARVEDRITEAFALFTDTARHDEVLRAFEELQREHPELPDPVVGIALAHLRAQKFELAIRSIEESSLRGTPELERLLAYLLPFRNGIRDAGRPEAPSPLPTALGAFIDALVLGFRGEHNDPAAVNRALERAQDAVLIAERPRQIYHRELAVAAARAKAAAVTKSAAASLVARWPESFAAHLAAAQTLSRIDPEIALVHYDRALRMRPHDASAHRDRARLLMELKRYEEAVPAAAKAVELDAEHADAYQTWIKSIAALGREDEACRITLEFSERLDSNPSWNFFAGQFLAQQGRVEEGRARLEKCLAAWPDFADAWGVLAGVHILQQDAEAAERASERALALDPKNSDGAGNLGLAYYLRGEFDRAISALEHAVRLTPHYHENLVNLIHALRAKKRWAEAAERAAALRPIALMNLGTEGDAPELEASLRESARLADLVRGEKSRIEREILVLDEWRRSGVATEEQVGSRAASLLADPALGAATREDRMDELLPEEEADAVRDLLRTLERWAEKAPSPKK
jgi:serine/threonine protein kinase/tetratricopeptide (TPR) repeat protein